MNTLTYEVDGPDARITLDRPERGNGITLEMPRELAAAVEQADLDPAVHVIALAGNGKGFCGGYDLVQSAERRDELFGDADAAGSPLDPATIASNHDPSSATATTWRSRPTGRSTRRFRRSSPGCAAALIRRVARAPSRTARAATSRARTPAC